jgi:hypothetical protein
VGYVRSLTIIAAVAAIAGAGGTTTASAAGSAVTRGPDGIVVTGAVTNDQLWGSHGADDIDCGPGRDAVRADRADRLRNCEIVRRS